MIGNIINKIDKVLGILIYNNLNSLGYNVFNSLYKKNILTKDFKNINKTVNDFELKGYSQIKGFDLNKIIEINNLLVKQNPHKSENNSFVYIIDESLKKIIKRIINEDCKKILDDLRNHFNSNIFLSHALITRNYNYDSSKGESYSSYFHCDGYLKTYFKILINLSDVNENMGPINILDKEKTKKNISIFKYSSRSLEKEKKLDNYVFKNISQIGSGLLISTTECLHKAGIPEKDQFRDMLYLIFCAYPNENQNIFHYEETNDTIWKSYSSLAKKLAKPYGYRKLINLYKNFLKNRIYNN